MLLWIMLTTGCKDRGETGDPIDTGEPAASLAWEAVAEDVAEGAFLSVWGATAEDVWIVGGQPEAGHILRGSGTTWTAQALPAGTPLLNWVHGTSSSDVWVAGISGTLLHWDGAAWSDHSIDTEAAFWGLYADADGSVLAVGGASRWGGEAAMVWGYDGSDWSTIALPEKLAGLGNLFKVHRGDDGRYWLVGAGGAAMVGDGTDFSAVATGYAGDLVTVSRPPAGGPLVVVGGRGTGIVMEPDGERLSASAEANAGLNGVCVYPSGLSVVVGERGYSALFDAETDTLTEVPPITLDILHATWGEAGGRMYAVGGNLNTAEDTFHGVILTAAAPE
jgi:hypothetical protein